MLTQEENELLCRVEGNAPMGQLMRRHWQPICLIEQVSEPDGKPIRARVLGENLVVFRDTNGKVGVMDELCPHRKASLVYGRNENCGLRCLYHGWKMDVSGNVVDMSSEPTGSGLAQKTKHLAYETTEWGGFVWAYMGAESSKVPFTPPPWAPSLETRVSIAKLVLPCNWAQILEGQIDSAHSSSLHSSDMVPARVDGAKATETNWLRPSTDKMPRMQVELGTFGFRYAAIRRPLQNANEKDYVRTTVFLAPSSALIPPNDQYNVANVNVAIDDTHTAFHFIAWGDAQKTPDTETWRAFLHTTKGADVDDDFVTRRTLANDFLQDREAMKKSNFTGIPGIPNQDTAMWVSMGPIVDRNSDRLGASDMAIVAFRQQMVAEVKAFRDGADPIGVGAKAVPDGVCAYQAIVDKRDDWRHFSAKPV